MISADKNHTAPNFSLVNGADLTRILQSEIFLNTNRQLRAAHIILGYKPISSSFQSLKNVINAKDPLLKQINVAVHGFLTSLPHEGSHQAILPVRHIVEDRATSPGSAREEETVKIIEVVDFKEDFEVFDRPDPIESPSTTSRPLPSNQIGTEQEMIDILEVLVLQRRKYTSLLELLESYAGGYTPEVAIQP